MTAAPPAPRLALRPYISVLAGRFQLMLQYRAAAFAGFITQCWFGVLRILIFAAFYAGGAVVAPMSLHNAVTYTWLGQGFLAFVPTGADPDVAEMVRSGAVAYERLRPVDTYGWWYARAVAWSVARVLPRAALLFSFAGVLIPLLGFGKWSLGLPPTPMATALFAASAAAMVLLSATVTVAINVVLVTTLDDRGPSVLAGAFIYFFSGMVLPLAFFPDNVRPWLRAQPFAGIVDIPYSIYFGGISGWGAASAIGLQLFWVATLALVGRWGLERAMRRLQVQGG